MIGNVVMLPLVLPQILQSMSVDAWAITQNLLAQMILPLAIGMLLRQFAQGLVAVIQPTVASLANLALYVLIVAMVIGYLPSLADLQV